MPIDKHIPMLGPFPFQELFIYDLLTTSHIEMRSKILPVQLGLALQGWFVLFSAVLCNPID